MRKSPTGDTVIRSGFRRRGHSEPLSQIRNLSALRMKTLRHPIDSPQNVIFVRFSGEGRQARGRGRAWDMRDGLPLSFYWWTIKTYRYFLQQQFAICLRDIEWSINLFGKGSRHPLTKRTAHQIKMIMDQLGTCKKFSEDIVNWKITEAKRDRSSKSLLGKDWKSLNKLDDILQDL